MSYYIDTRITLLPPTPTPRLRAPSVDAVTDSSVRNAYGALRPSVLLYDRTFSGPPSRCLILMLICSHGRILLSMVCNEHFSESYKVNLHDFAGCIDRMLASHFVAIHPFNGRTGSERPIITAGTCGSNRRHIQ